MKPKHRPVHHFDFDSLLLCEVNAEEFIEKVKASKGKS